MENTEISWTDHTANLWWGCQEVHAGCDFCYAKALDNRYNHDHPNWGKQSGRKIVLSVWNNLAKFQRDAAASNTIKSVFVGSMMDIFEKSMQVVDNNGSPIEGLTTADLRDRLFSDIIPKSPNLLFLLLTKRNGNIAKYIPKEWRLKQPDNVMYGTSVVNQQTHDDIAESFYSLPGRKFFSMEPLLDNVHIKRINEISWVITGGESGTPEARPMSPEWVRNIKRQCDHEGVDFHFKQWGEYLPLIPLGHGLKADDGSSRIYHHEKKNMHKFVRTHNQLFYNGGKKENGSLLDGLEYKELPKTM